MCGIYSRLDSQLLEDILRGLNGLQETLSTNLTLSVTITSGDTNSWGDMFESWIFTFAFRAILPIFALCCCYFATMRFISYWTHKRSQIALVCLFIEAITNLERAMYCAIDPFTSQNIFSWQVSRMLMFVTIPWSLSTSLLIGLFWAESLARMTRIKHDFLTRYKVHFIVMLVLLILLELFASIVHAFRLPNIRIPIILAISLVGVCAQLVVALLFLITGFKVLRMLAYGLQMVGPSKDREIRLSRLRRMTNRIMGSGVGMIVFVVSAAFAGTSLIFRRAGYFLILFGIYMGLQITSILQIFAFSIPQKSKSRVVAVHVQPERTGTTPPKVTESNSTELESKEQKKTVKQSVLPLSS